MTSLYRSISHLQLHYATILYSLLYAWNQTLMHLMWTLDPSLIPRLSLHIDLTRVCEYFRIWSSGALRCLVHPPIRGMFSSWQNMGRPSTMAYNHTDCYCGDCLVQTQRTLSSTSPVTGSLYTWWSWTTLSSVTSLSLHLHLSITEHKVSILSGHGQTLALAIWHNFIASWCPLFCYCPD